MHRQQQRQFLVIARHSGVAALAASLLGMGCATEDPDATATTTQATEDPTDATTEPQDSTGAETETGTDPTTATEGTEETTDPTTDPTTDTDATAGGRVVECDDPGTMVWDGDVYIDSPEDMELLAGHSEVNGDVKIFEPAVDNVDFMACITAVHGNIQVFGTTATDLAGLNNLEVLDGSLSISENPNLVEIFGFDGLTRIGADTALSGALIITKNDALTGIYGFDGLQQIELGINIDENPVLTGIPGLANLVAVGTEAQPGGTYPALSIAYNPELSSIAGLVGIQALGGQLVIQANPKLCISEVMSLADMLEQWIQEGMGDTTGNDGSC